MVDTDRIDPEKKRLGIRSFPSKEEHEVLSDSEVRTIETYCMRSQSRTPNVGKGVIFLGNRGYFKVFELDFDFAIANFTSGRRQDCYSDSGWRLKLLVLKCGHLSLRS